METIRFWGSRLQSLIAMSDQVLIMEQIDYDIDDFMSFCKIKNLSKKTMASYEQTLRLFAIYLKVNYNIKEAGEVKEIHIREYIKNLQERGKYTVVANVNTKNINFPQNRKDY